MPEQNETTFLAREGMTFAKSPMAAITAGRQAWGFHTIAKVQPISKLLGREASAILWDRDH
jgi:hypothetical protein